MATCYTFAHVRNHHTPQISPDRHCAGRGGRVRAGAIERSRAGDSHPSGEMAMIPAEPHSGLNRGIGVYPGDPAEYFGPALEADTSGRYRNLALRRAAYHSSSYDYNLTAQLVTDGIVDSSLPAWLEVETAFGGVLPKEEREFAFDHAPDQRNSAGRPRPWLQFNSGRRAAGHGCDGGAVYGGGDGRAAGADAPDLRLR